jgi:uncharacterized membrane protein
LTNNLFYTFGSWFFRNYQQVDRPTFIDNFLRDPFANGIAVLVLIGMIACVIAVLIYFLSESDPKGWNWPRWSVPILAILGLAVSAYLLYVEATGAQAVCGPTGDCNAVQHSPYARLFGIIPIGLMGIAGYVAILVAWLISSFGPARLQRALTLAIWGMAWFGIIFSIYLTFLEPFVIGATCMWCISSAIIMSLLFLASTRPAKELLKIEEDDFGEEEFSEA